MYFVQLLALCVLKCIPRSVGDTPEFRILAPPFVCPKDNDAVIDKPDNTVITLQSDTGEDVVFSWTVRWFPLEAPTQRFTLALWRSVRELERQLNGPQAEPGVYIIDNTALLSGVNYIFNVSASYNGFGDVMEKSFHIDNVKGDPKLFIEGRSDMFAIALVGGQVVYADIEYMLEAVVTTCFKTHDYYFAWSVYSGDSWVNVSDVKGARLEIKPNSLTPGLSYNVLCKVFKNSNGEFITQNVLPFQVLHRIPKVYFSVDVLVVSVGTPFSIPTNIRRIDYLEHEVNVTWTCTLNDEVFDDYRTNPDGSMTFPSGLPEVGEYLVSVKVDVLDKPLASFSTARIITVETQLPVIEVYLTPRLINEGKIVNLQANITHVTPGCSITWYFLYDECFSTTNTISTERCTEHENGKRISDPVNVYSLEENFLSELTDYSNETGWKSAPAQVNAATGTARLVVTCQCNLLNNCSTEGSVYAEVKLRVNEKPGAGVVTVTPETGTAMETVFRLSTRALMDPNRPLQYTFYCDLGNNESLVLGTYLEHLAIETLLPYIDGATSIWLEVCDSLGACSVGVPTLVVLSTGEARTVDALIDDLRAHVRRCEMGWLLRLTVSTIVTYNNAGQTEAYTKFIAAVLETLRSIDEICTEIYTEQYSTLLYWLSKYGVDTSEFL